MFRIIKFIFHAMEICYAVADGEMHKKLIENGITNIEIDTRIDEIHENIDFAKYLSYFEINAQFAIVDNKVVVINNSIDYKALLSKLYVYECNNGSNSDYMQECSDYQSLVRKYMFDSDLYHGYTEMCDDGLTFDENEIYSEVLGRYNQNHIGREVNKISEISNDDFYAIISASEFGLGNE